MLYHQDLLMKFDESVEKTISSNNNDDFEFNQDNSINRRRI